MDRQAVAFECRAAHGGTQRLQRGEHLPDGGQIVAFRGARAVDQVRILLGRGDIGHLREQARHGTVAAISGLLRALQHRALGEGQRRRGQAFRRGDK